MQDQSSSTKSSPRKNSNRKLVQSVPPWPVLHQQLLQSLQPSPLERALWLSLNHLVHGSVFPRV